MNRIVIYTGCFDIVEGPNSISFNGIKDGEGLSQRYIIPHANASEIEIGPAATPPAVGQTITITYPREDEGAEG